VIGYLLKAGEHPGAAVEKKPAVPTKVEEALPVVGKVEQPAALAGMSGKVKASPAARHRARQQNIDLIKLAGTGPGGRVVAWNVSSPIKAEPRVSPVAQRVAEALKVDLSLVKGSGPGGMITRQDVENRTAATPTNDVVPFTRQQRIMAERMSASFRNAPHFYLHVEADVRHLVKERQVLLPELEERCGIHLTYTDLLVNYCALSLVNHRLVMAQWTESGLKQAAEVNIGVAMDTPNGLIVPVIHQADQLSLTEIALKRTELAERARLGKLIPQDLELGVFTLTNLGMLKIDSFDAILNPPQAGILAVGRIKERAIVENGQVVAATMMNLSLSVDHRVLDGASGARFLGDLVELIENPGLVLT
jgi:pyruvate dehydrogenase E2 component (dihydrolipoamide acetyltransferase)